MASNNRFGSVSGKPPAYHQGFGPATTTKPPTPSKAHSVPVKLHSSVGSRLNSSLGTTTSIAIPADQTVKFDKENVMVSVRLRPLQPREMNNGDEPIWITCDNTTVSSDLNGLNTYTFDRVFSTATPTQVVYDATARHVVSGAMKGINGTVFAYGVTNSGKTHTMHGDQQKPGIIPLAIMDIFNIIQATPEREYLLRVSYMEIYNEFINDLLNPAAHNLKIRDANHGTYVEGIKQEPVVTPGHALLLIASGEEHRHVGSNNLNMMSSRSHTIFTLTIESSARGEGSQDEQVTLSQLHLIDLAGSESSKTADTRGLRKQEGAYINKSLLTLGTVISKLTDGKSNHIPYRDSKLTRFLQSSLSGHGRVSLICTISPASSSHEEANNTLKFAQRAKRVELYSSANKILDDKSAIKQYQREISKLKKELEQLRMNSIPQTETNVNRKQVEELRTRVEEQEQEKEALVNRINKLSKLILVSSKSNNSNAQDRPSHRRRYSFGEEELAYLPERRRGFGFDEEDVDLDTVDGSSDGGQSETAPSVVDAHVEVKKSKKRGVLGWLKPKKREHHPVSSSSSVSTEADLHGDTTTVKKNVPVIAGELFAHGRRPPPTGTTMADEMDLLRETVAIHEEQIAVCITDLKRLKKQAGDYPNAEIQAEVKRLEDELQAKRQVKQSLEAKIEDKNLNPSQQISKLRSQLNEKGLELVVKTADNRFLQEQLQSKDSENAKLRESIASLKQQLEDKMAFVDKKVAINHKKTYSNGQNYVFDTEEGSNWLNDVDLSRELKLAESKPGMNGLVSHGFTPKVLLKDLQPQMLAQANEIEKLKQEVIRLKDENLELERKCEKSMEDTIHAQQLAASAAGEIKGLIVEVNKLSLKNDELSNELEAVRSSSTVSLKLNVQSEDGLAEFTSKATELERSLKMREQMEGDLKRQLEGSKRREKDLENELALRGHARNEEQPGGEVIDVLDMEADNGKENRDVDEVEQLRVQLETERCKVENLELQNSQLKGENLNNVDVASLDALQNLHVEALTKLHHARTKAQERIEKERAERERKWSLERRTSIGVQHLLLEEERNGNMCKVCYESPTAAVLLPCRHFCLCKDCATGCKECPICRSEITEQIITFTS